jgi:hypothetical protein
MDFEQIFAMANMAALAGWAILVLTPRRWPWLNRVASMLIPLAISAVYAALVVVNFGTTEGGFGTLADVRLLFSSDAMLLAGWVHYLAFDLFVGAVMARQMDTAGIHRVVQAPFLILIFMLGPLGYLATMMLVGALRVMPAQTTKEV